MRVLVVLVAMLLVACAEPKPEQPDEDAPDDEVFDCEFSKDKKFLVCHDRKRREVATKAKDEQ